MKLKKKTVEKIFYNTGYLGLVDKNKLKILYLYLKTEKNIAFIDPSDEVLRATTHDGNTKCYMSICMNDSSLKEVCLRNDLIVFFRKSGGSPAYEKLIWLAQSYKRQTLFFNHKTLGKNDVTVENKRVDACLATLYNLNS